MPANYTSAVTIPKNLSYSSNVRRNAIYGTRLMVLAAKKAAATKEAAAPVSQSLCRPTTVDAFSEDVSHNMRRNAIYYSTPPHAVNKAAPPVPQPWCPPALLRPPRMDGILHYIHSPHIKSSRHTPHVRRR